jgi:hypothetical protein
MAQQGGARRWHQPGPVMIHGLLSPTRAFLLCQHCAWIMQLVVQLQ